MTSKNSTASPSLWKLIRENLRHNSVLTILSVLANFIASPVVFIFCTTDITRESVALRYSQDTSREMISQIITGSLVRYLESAYMILHVCVLTAGAVLVAIVAFRYLFHRRMVDLYHSVPVSRTRQFLSQWITGFLIWFVPFLTGSLFILIAGCARIGTVDYMGIFALCWLKLVLLLTLCFLIVYHVSLVGVMLSGNALNALINICFCGLFIGVAYLISLVYCANFFDTFMETGNNLLYSIIASLSPLAAPIFICYAYAEELLLTDWIAILPGSMIICGLNFIMALLLYKKRSSESAERGLDHKYFRIVFRFLISTLLGLSLAVFFSLLAKSASYHQMPWILFGGIFGSILSFCTMNIIYHANFKEITSHKLQMAFSAILVCLISACFRYDVFGYDTYVPSEKTIRGCSVISFQLIDDAYWFQPDGNGSYTQVDDLSGIYPSGTISTDAKAIHEMLSALTEREKNADYLCNLYVRVDTCFGSYYRRYEVCQADVDALTPIIHTEVFKEHYYPASTGKLTLPSSIRIYGIDNSECYLVEKEKISELYRAYQEDFDEIFEANEWTYFLRFPELYTMDFLYNEGNSHSQFTLKLSDNFQRTTSLLKEWLPEGIWTEDEITVSELSISMNLYEDTPEEYLGLVERVPGKADAFTETNCRTYRLHITDPEDLASLRPYLHFTRSGNPPYPDCVFIGYASTTFNKYDDYRCYIDLGTMPEKIAKQIEEVDYLSDDYENVYYE